MTKTETRSLITLCATNHSRIDFPAVGVVLSNFTHQRVCQSQVGSHFYLDQ